VLSHRDWSCGNTSTHPTLARSWEPTTQGFPDTRAGISEVPCTQVPSGALGVRKRLRQSTSRPGVASAAFGTIAHMARCLSALDGRPGADRSRGTGSTRSRKEDCGLHSPRNHAADRAPGRDRPGRAAVAPAHRAVAPGLGVGPAARPGGALNEGSAAETATLAFAVRTVKTTALVITRERISLR
jgi:hypothetical protein